MKNKIEIEPYSYSWYGLVVNDVLYLIDRFELLVVPTINDFEGDRKKDMNIR